MPTKINPDDKVALAEKTLRLGIEIVEQERACTVSSFKERDGKVRDWHALKDIRRYDRFLRGARKVLA